jgi:hypothetical protein
LMAEWRQLWFSGGGLFLSMADEVKRLHYSVVFYCDYV